MRTIFASTFCIFCTFTVACGTAETGATSQSTSSSSSSSGTGSGGAGGAGVGGSGGAGGAGVGGSGSGGSGGSGGAQACNLAGYPIDYHSSGAEQAALKDAVDAFHSAHPGVTVTVSSEDQSIASISGGVPLTLDMSILDRCARSVAALQAFLHDQAAIVRAPLGMTLKSCTADDVLDRDVIRLQGGTYMDGRSMLGRPDELLAHVSAAGDLVIFTAAYTPALTRPSPTPCLSAEEAADAVIGDPLEYHKFQMCVPKGPGSITIADVDTRAPGDVGVFIDETGFLHYVREVDVFLATSRVNQEVGNSDLYCCASATVEDCVGKTLLVDELTGETLAQIPRCHTC